MGTGELSGKPYKMLGGGGEERRQPCDGLPSLPGGSGNIPSCFMLHGNQSKLRLGGPTGSSTDFIFKQ